MNPTQTYPATPTPMAVLSTAENGRRIRVQDPDGKALWAVNAASTTCVRGDSALVVTASNGEGYVIGIIPGESRTRVEFDGSTIRVLDINGQAVLEYDEHSSKVRLVGIGDLEVATPAGDLTLASGKRVHISGGTGIDLVSAGMVRTMTPRASTILGSGEYRVGTERLDIAATTTNASVGQFSIAGTRASVVFGSVRASVDRLESISSTVICRTQDFFSDVSRLAQATASRMRLVVQEGFYLRSGRTHMRSQQTTRIDGAKIHLG